ncbi:MAG: ATP-binding protein [Burkholderiaceae bacterium]
MKPLPRTLFGQMLLALFAGLLAVQTAGFWLMLDERARFGERVLGAYAAQRIAGVISLVDQTAPAERARLVQGLSVPPMHLALGQPWQDGAPDRGPDAREFLDSVARELDRPVALQVLAIRRAEARPGPPHALPPETAELPETSRPPALPEAPAPPAAPAAAPQLKPPRRWHGRPFLLVVGQARLADGTVLTFRHGLPQQGLDLPLRLLLLLGLLGVSVALLAGWAVRRLTRPLATLADAAGGLARNLDQPPLPETGPLEVARAARAFNAMQRDLKRLLDTRAQALAAVSHDLRLPITRLRLRMERLPDEALRRKMEEDLAEMDGMIGGTLDYLRAGSSAEPAARLDLDALVDSVADDLAELGADIRLHGSIGAPVSGRPQALRRCLANLLDNARRYGNGPIDVTLAAGAAQAAVRIEDRGPGIPAADLDKVFEPYVRLDASRARHTGGTGLGLAIARAIARAHGGDVALAARPGGGTTATLTLPSAPATDAACAGGD